MDLTQNISKEINRTSVLNFLTTFGSIAYFGYAFLYWFMGLKSLGIFNLVSGVTFLLLKITLSYTRNFFLVSHILIGVTYFSLVVINFTLGAEKAPTLIWILMANIGAAYLLGFKASRFWFILTLFHPLVLFLLKRTSLNVMIYDLSDQQFDLLYISSFISFTLLAIIFLLFYQKSYLSLLDRFEKSTEKAKGMLRIIEHDLGNPLTIILASSDRLKIDYPGNLYIDKIDRATKKLIKILNSVRELDLVESGKKELELTNINLKDCIFSARELIEEKLSDKNIVLDLTCSNIQRGVCVRANKDLLTYQVFVNIFTNAIKFSPKGSKVIVSCEDDSDFVVISVKDFGIGIPEDLQMKIFDPYSITHRKGTMDESGSGYGLPITKFSLEQMNGDIQVKSSTERDSSFTEFQVFLKKA